MVAGRILAMIDCYRGLESQKSMTCLDGGGSLDRHGE